MISVDEYPRPDWVMCGAPGPAGGVRLLASKDLTQAELDSRAETEDIWPMSPYRRAVSHRTFLTAQMRSFTIIDAIDYPAAFKALFEHWTPGPAARTAISDGQRAITGW